VLIGSDLTLEEARLVLEFAKNELGGASVFHFGTPGVFTSQDDGDADRILKRKSKTSNLHGMEKLGILPYRSIPETIDNVVIFRGGKALVPDLAKARVFAVGVFQTEEVEGYSVVIPGLPYTEKTGTIINSQGMEQKLNRAVQPRGMSKPLSDFVMLWKNTDLQAEWAQREKPALVG
jgi:hypothetical protein